LGRAFRFGNAEPLEGAREKETADAGKPFDGTSKSR